MKFLHPLYPLSMITRVIRPQTGLLRALFPHETFLLAPNYCSATGVPVTVSGFSRSPKSPKKRITNSHELFLRDLQKSDLDSSIQQPSLDGSLEGFEQYIQDPTRSVEDILSVDVREIPAIAKYACLEALLKLLNKTGSASVQATLRSFENTASGHRESWPLKYLVVEHAARWADWGLGINPMLDFKEPQFVHSPRFDLLVLSVASSANQLPLPILLRLAGHFSYLWRFYDPKVFASILRLITGQVNELGLNDIFRLTTVIRDIPRTETVQTSDTTNMTESSSSKKPDSSDTLSVLVEEASLLRTTLSLHVISKLTSLETFDAVTLLRFMEEIGPCLSKADQFRLLLATESSLILNPQQQSLYSLVYLCTKLCSLQTYRRGIVHRVIGQLQRKLRLAQRFPGTDHSRWIGAVVASLANLSVGASQMVAQSADAVELFVRPPCMPNGRTPTEFCSTNRYPGVDISTILCKDWVQETFRDLTGYVVSRPGSSRNSLLEIAYSLALMGYRADIILEQAYGQSSDLVDAAVNDSPPYLSLIELLVGSPNTSLSVNGNLNYSSWLPRIEWQLYLRLSSEHRTNTQICDSNVVNQLTDYVMLKKPLVSDVTDRLHSRLWQNTQLDMLNFHRLQINGDKNSFFSDILFKKESTCSSGIVKLALCFVCYKRDLLVSRPLETLLETYRKNLSKIPVFIFDYTKYTQLDTTGRREHCDTFLSDVAREMMDSPGVPTEQVETWTDAPFNVPTM